MTPPRARAAAGPDSPVRARRTAERYTQAQLGELVGATRHTVLAIEAGDYAPSVFLALRIARVLGTTVEELFGADPQSQLSPTGETP